MMWKILLAIFLAGHGLIHLGYLAPAPSDPNYPFRLDKSWLVSSVGLSAEAVRSLGILLSLITLVGFAVSGLAAAGIVVPQDWWQPFTLVGSLASLLLLVMFWHTWLILGVAIDVALLVAVVWLHWQPFTEVGI